MQFEARSGKIPSFGHFTAVVVVVVCVVVVVVGDVDVFEPDGVEVIVGCVVVVVVVVVNVVVNVVAAIFSCSTT
jgi:hypothetical protein